MKVISQHNESRKVFPRLIFLGLADLTGWDIRAELAVIVALVCGAAGAIFALGLEKLVSDPQKRLEIERSPRITAWAFDTDRGTVYPLEGSYSFPQKP
jgi:hypothetical protein